MTSLDVAPEATSPRTPSPVVKRQLLTAGGIIVGIKIPKSAVPGVFTGEETEVRYVNFPRFVRGGVIHFYLRLRDENPQQYLNKRIVAEAEVWMKELVDGRSFLYVDLYPQAEETRPTRQIVVTADRLPANCRDRGFDIFEVLAPLRGAIIVAPAGEKIDLMEPRWAPPPKQAKGVTTPSTGDHQLARLLADGWVIGHEDVTTVVLHKGEGGEWRTLVHHRSKSKGPNGSKNKRR